MAFLASTDVERPVKGTVLPGGWHGWGGRTGAVGARQVADGWQMLGKGQDGGDRAPRSARRAGAAWIGKPPL
jgi:hypothetical protein